MPFYNMLHFFMFWKVPSLRVFQGLTFVKNQRIDSTVIPVTSTYENQFLSISYTVNAAVSVKFDSHELR